MSASSGTILKNDTPLYPIGIVAELIGTTVQTLRIYEKHGLIKPARKNKARYYSEDDVKWLSCLRELIHEKKISIEGIKRLLGYAPCWALAECSEHRKNDCSAFIGRTRPCWELNRVFCEMDSQSLCTSCSLAPQSL